MKISKLLLLGAALAGIASSAFAQTEVYIAGSTAYRAGVTKAIQDVLNQNPTGFQQAWDGSPIYKSTAIFSGTYNGTWTIIHTYWTGSAAGVIDLAQANPITKWMPDSIFTSGSWTAAQLNVAPGATGTAAYVGGIVVTGSYAPITATETVAMSDADKNSVALSLATAPGNGPTLSATISGAGLVQTGTLGQTVTGILPFEWVAGHQTNSQTTFPGAPSAGSTCPLANITQEAATYLVQAGRLPLGCFAKSTSDPIVGDTNDWVFLIGRNEDSGTRIAAQAESQVGSNLGKKPFGNSMKQNYAIFNGTVTTDGSFPGETYLENGVATGLIQCGGAGTTLVDIGLWPSNSPVNTEPSVNWNVKGHSGQIGGGDVAKVLQANNPLTLSISNGIDTGVAGNPNSIKPNNWNAGTSCGYLVGYLGLADVPTSGVTPLTYNGVAYAPQALLEGAYDFWTFEHTYYRLSGVNAVGAGQAFADAMTNQLETQDCQTDSTGLTDPTEFPSDVAVGGLIYGNSNFSRTQEGAPITILGD